MIYNNIINLLNSMCCFREMCGPMQQKLGCLFLTKNCSFPNAKSMIFNGYQQLFNNNYQYE